MQAFFVCAEDQKIAGFASSYRYTPSVGAAVGCELLGRLLKLLPILVR
jgi:hypothetical protein